MDISTVELAMSDLFNQVCKKEFVIYDKQTGKLLDDYRKSERILSPQGLKDLFPGLK